MAMSRGVGISCDRFPHLLIGFVILYFFYDLWVVAVGGPLCCFVDHLQNIVGRGDSTGDRGQLQLFCYRISSRLHSYSVRCN